MKGKVIVEGAVLRLYADGRILDEQRRENLDHIYRVFAGSDIDFINPDTNFHVFAFIHNIWVLPRKTEGVSTVIYETWKDYISQAKIFCDADLPELPWSWRKRFLGGLIHFPEPQLLVLPSADIPKWRLREPFDSRQSRDCARRGDRQ